MKTNRNIIVLAFVLVVLMIGAVIMLQPKPPQPLKPVFTQVQTPQRVLVYFSKNKGSEIITEPVVRALPEPKPQSSKELFTYAVSQLLRGPSEKEQDAGYFSEIPPGTKLIEIKETPKAIAINLSQEYVTGGGSNSMMQRLDEITKTVVSIPQKKPVYLEVEGKQLNVLGGEGVIVHEPITGEPRVAQ